VEGREGEGMKQSYKAFMCATDFYTEWKSNPEKECPEMYKTIKELKAKRACWKECGIEEVIVKRVRARHKGKL